MSSIIRVLSLGYYGNKEQPAAEVPIPLSVKPKADDVAKKNNFKAEQIDPGKALLSLLEKLNDNPEVLAQLLKDLDDDDPLCQLAKQLLDEDLSSSKVILTDTKKAEEWLAGHHLKQELKEDGWDFLDDINDLEPPPGQFNRQSFRVTKILIVPAKFIWKGAKLCYSLISTLWVPIAFGAAIIQSPWTSVILLILKKLARRGFA